MCQVFHQSQYFHNNKPLSKFCPTTPVELLHSFEEKKSVCSEHTYDVCASIRCKLNVGMILLISYYLCSMTGILTIQVLVLCGALF